jgi:uncharacterized protein with von Willebrand factor type A (vWA) domain
MPDPLAHLVGFARELRGAGIAAGTDQLVAMCRAAQISRPSEIYWVGRVSLLTGMEQIAVYDDVFCRYWGRLEPAAGEDRPAAPVDREVDGSPAGDAEGAARGLEGTQPSRIELLRQRSFDSLEDSELDEVAAHLRALLRHVPMRPSRRSRSARSGTLDLRRTVTRTLRQGGEAHDLAFRRPGVRRRRLVLLLDTSGSMTRHTRALLILGHAAATAGRWCEVFCFATRLTRVTPELRRSTPEQALARAAERVADWDGGTLIGRSLQAFLDEHGQAGMARGAVVVIASDGFEAGDPGLLRTQMARLGRLAHRVIWLNPLKAQPGYEPLARGMAAALPHVETFAAGDSLASLEEVFACRR